MTPSSATQSPPQPADYSTSVRTGTGGRPNALFRNMCRSMRVEGCSASHCEDPHRIGDLVKCTGVGSNLQVSMLLWQGLGNWVTTHLYTTSLCSSISPVFLRGQLKVRHGSVMINTARTVVSVARSVVLRRVCTRRSHWTENINTLLLPMMSYNCLIWVGRSPARLILVFRPSVQNFSRESPLQS